MSLMEYLVLYTQVDELAKRNSLIRSGDVAIFPEFPSSINNVYQIASSVAYVLTWIATVMLLRPYIEKFGKLKFWSIMGATMAYYLIQFPLFSLGYYTPSENSNAMTNILIFSLSFCHIYRNTIWSRIFIGSKNSKNWYCRQELYDNCCLWLYSLLHRWLYNCFTSRLSTVWTCICGLYRIILLFDIQWSLFFSNFSFSRHDVAPIN